MRRQVRERNLLTEARASRGGHPEIRTLEQKLLAAAERQAGVLTVTQAVQATGLSFERAEEVLRSMVASGYVDVDNEPGSGVVIYRFPELEGRSLSTRRGVRTPRDR